MRRPTRQVIAVPLSAGLVLVLCASFVAAQDASPAPPIHSAAVCPQGQAPDAPCAWDGLTLNEVTPGVFRVLHDGARELDAVKGVEIMPDGAIWVRTATSKRRPARVFELGQPASYKVGNGRLASDHLDRPRMVDRSKRRDESMVFRGGKWRKQPLTFEDMAAFMPNWTVGSDGSRWRISLDCPAGSPQDGDCTGRFRQTIRQVLEPGTANRELDRHGYEDTNFYGERSPFSIDAYAAPLPMSIVASADGRVWVTWVQPDWADLPRRRRQAVAVTEWGVDDPARSGLIRQDMWLDPETLEGRVVVPWGEAGGSLGAAPDGRLWLASMATQNGRRGGREPLWEVSVWDGDAWAVTNVMASRELDLAFGPDGTAWANGLTRLGEDAAMRYRIRDRAGQELELQDLAYHPDASHWAVARGRLYAIIPELATDPGLSP